MIWVITCLLLLKEVLPGNEHFKNYSVTSQYHP